MYKYALLDEGFEPYCRKEFTRRRPKTGMKQFDDVVELLVEERVFPVLVIRDDNTIIMRWAKDISPHPANIRYARDMRDWLEELEAENE